MHMYKFILFICFVFCFFLEGLGQNTTVDSIRTSYDQSYGLNAILTNGKKYFPPERPVNGNPFWKKEDAYLAAVTVSGQTFANQQVKYELHLQQFVLYYSNYLGQQSQIILNNMLIDSVSMGNCLFIQNTSPAITLPFVQLIRKGKLTCIIAWSKDLALNNTGQKAGFEYSKEHTRKYLNYKGKDHRFSSKSSFLKIFDSKERAPIRKYISSKHLKFKKMNDDDLKWLGIFGEQYLN